MSSLLFLTVDKVKQNSIFLFFTANKNNCNYIRPNAHLRMSTYFVDFHMKNKNTFFYY